MGIIYKVTSPTNKVYIGQCKRKKRKVGRLSPMSPKEQMKKRWEEHCGKWSRCNSLKKAITRYGESNMKVEILVVVADSELDLYEKRFVDLYQSGKRKFGYNKTKGGQSGGFSNEKVRNKQKAPGSKWHVAQKQPETTAAKLLGLQRAKELDPDVEKRRKENAKAATQTAEYRQNASKVHLVAQNRPETRAKRVSTWARKREERLMQLPLEEQEKERERMAKHRAVLARYRARKKAGIPTRVYVRRKG